MVSQINFRNKSTTKIEILVEPSAEYIDIKPEEEVKIEFRKKNDTYNDELSITIENNVLIIYEPRQLDMTIQLDELIVFKSSV